MGGVRAATFAVAVGVVGAQLVPDGTMPWAVAAGALALGLGLAARHAAAPARTALALAACVLGGAAAGRGRAEMVQARPLPPDHVARLALPRRAVLDGRVIATPTVRDGDTVLLLDAERLDGGTVVAGRVRLTVRGRVPAVRAGDGVRVRTTLRRPRGFRNPGSVDVAAHLARRDVLVTASAWTPDAVVRLPRAPDGPRVRLERWRQRLLGRIAAAAPGTPGAVLQALVLGEQGRIPDATRDAFARAGVVHILSVSGLHVGLVAAAAWWAVRATLARSTWLLLHVDVGAVAAVASLGPVLLYAALAGLEVPTLRSALMVAAAALGGLLGRRVGVLRALALAAVVVALAWPGAPREIGFQLSFASVLAIVLAARRFAPGPATGWRARTRAGAVATVAAMAGTAPLAALHFQQVSLVGVVANPLAIPLFGSVVVVLGLVAACVEPLAPQLASAGFTLAGCLLRPGLALVETLGRPWWAAWPVPTPDVAELLLCAVVFAGVLGWPARAARLALAAGLVGLAVDAGWWWRARHADVLRVTFLDVGQGDATVAELPGGAVLVVDGGGFPGSRFDVGDAVVRPFLRTRKILAVDALVLSHPHPDHFAGLTSLFRDAAPGALWWTGHAGRGVAWDAFAAARRAAGVPARVLAAGDALPLPGVDGVVLHPPAGWTPASVNDGSLVLRVRHGDVAMLLTGDVESGGEGRMRADGVALAAAVVKAPHHGSRTSSTPGFVAATRPAVVVIPVGADNRYRLPVPDVETRWRAAGACVLRTDRCGAVTVVTDGVTLAVSAVDPACGCPAPALRRPGP